MGRICRETQEWVEQQVEQPIETWENQQETRCRTESCFWLCLCCNKLFCWLVWVLVKVVRIVLVTIGKWVARAVCEVVNVGLDLLAFLVTLILSIPILGGIIRTIWNWVTEIVWRLVGLLDFFGSLVGIRPRKKMYFGVVVPSVNGVAVRTDADIQRQVDGAIELYDRTCNINLIFTSICHTPISAPDDGLRVSCDAEGFFHDWLLAGSYFEFATATCKFTDTFRRVIGLGAELIVFIVPDIQPPLTNGCSFGSTHNYVVIEANPSDSVCFAAHEMGHACWLGHTSGDAQNLMDPTVPLPVATLDNLQVSLVRWSKHCVYI